MGSAIYAGVTGLQVHQRRLDVIASNIANIEQPNYRRVDLAPGFQDELNRALGSRDAARLTGIQPRLAVDPTAVAGSRDGNSVRLEHEMTQLAQNAVQHAVENHLITGNLLKLRLAITGRPV